MSDQKTSDKPFNNIRVIDFTHVLAGPAGAYQLALLGADVIKIEEIGTGDTVRNRGGSSNELLSLQMGTNFLAQNANKLSIAIDIKRTGGQEIVRRLAENADVFVENHRAETLPRYGLGAEDLLSINSRLIYCSMTGYGHSGPKYNDPAYDVNIQAASGFMSLTGTPEVSPLRAGAPIMDYATGLAGAFAIASALFQRVESGRGQFVDLAMLDIAFCLMSSTVTNTLTTGNVPKPKGNQANSRLPTSGNFPTGKGLLSLGLNEEHQFERFAKVVGRSDWLEDTRFSTMKTRAANAESIIAEIENVLKEKSAEEWEQLLQPAGVPAAWVRSLPDVLQHVQVTERGILKTISDIDGQGKDAGVVGTPFRLSDCEQHQIDRPPPRLGQHSLEILEEIGYDSAARQRFVEGGIVGVD